MSLLSEDLTKSLRDALASLGKSHQLDLPIALSVNNDSGYEGSTQPSSDNTATRDSTLSESKFEQPSVSTGSSFQLGQEHLDHPTESAFPDAQSTFDVQNFERKRGKEDHLVGAANEEDPAPSLREGILDRFVADPSNECSDMSTWYRNMFKKMHKIESPAESSILRHRLRESSPLLTTSRPMTPLSFTAHTPTRYECELTPRRAKSVGRIVESSRFGCLGEGESSSTTTAEEIAELKRISKEELLYRQKAERLAEELQDQRNRRHGYIPSTSPSFLSNKDRFGGLLDEYSRPSSTSLHPTSVRTATAIFKFDAKSPRELSLSRGDIIRVRREVDMNWLEGERNGQCGLFPRSYVQMDDEFDRSRSKAKVIYPFTPRRDTELRLKMGEVVTIRREIDENWYEGTNHLGEIGIFPRNYVSAIHEKSESNSDILTNSPDRPKTPKVSERDEHFAGPHRYTATSAQETSTSSQSTNYDKNRVTKDTINEMRTNGLSGTELTVQGSAKKEAYMCTADKIPKGSQTYRALYKFTPTKSDEVALEVNDIIFVVEKCDDGWYIGTVLRTGQFGTFPGNYVERH
ncbi:Sorbin and SH3 domain-containing protein 1 [Parelaphostrongylus tenuis]|uniref:Sorbin and SH3 domain-containing protein 1 n=1 Tax=Parelaphostrongylus tenuis TaxID=148309 RepID=A0AAD5QII4_PARTN|nr:Sorbin and SH3 domain-containing protein 1 [Parelaphostrongylus tenuis]